MPARNHDLHGSVPEKSAAALLLIDVINDLEFDGGEKLLENALPMAERLVELADRARAAGIPVIYVNDNFGKWRSDFRALLDHCLHDCRGTQLARMLRPKGDDYFVLKPKHSGFFSTTLDTLLEYLGARSLVLTGLTTDLCVLFTASDAHMRDFRVFVPSDCCAAKSRASHDAALTMMQETLDLDTRPAAELDLDLLARGD